MTSWRLALVCLVLLAAPVAQAEVYYVAVGGSSGNDGLTPQAPWSIDHAFTTATAGDTVHVKAGDYGEQFLVVANSGTPGNPIAFVGYTDIPGDVVSSNGSTISYGEPLSPETMPLLESIRVNSEGSGTAISANLNSHIVIENFQIRYYELGIHAQGGQTTIRNVIAVEQGDFNPAHSYPSGTDNAFLNYSGRGIVVHGDGALVENCLVVNAGAEGIIARSGSGITLRNNAVYADQNVNPTDYYVLIANGTTDSLVENTTVERVGNLLHGGHGICLKGNEPVTGNVVEGFNVTNTNVEVQFPLVSNNTLRNGTINRPPGGDNDNTALVLANGSHHNTYENIVIDGGNVSFRDWDDGLSGDEKNSSDDNVLRNLIVKNNLSGIAFHYFHVNNHPSAADNNVFENCLFVDLDFLFEIDRANSNTQLINTIIHDVGAYSLQRITANPLYPIDVSFAHTNFSSVGFAVPAGTSVTQHEPGFVDAAQEDFRLEETSPLVDAGTVTGAAADIDGVPRPQGLGFDLGPYEAFDPTSAALVLQESEPGFCGVDGTVDSDNAGFTGSGYANSDNALGVSILWSVDVPTAGPRDVVLRFANASTNPRDGELEVNGVPTGVVVAFPPTGAWTDWTTSMPVTVTLEAGINQIALTATTDEGLANIDYLSIANPDTDLNAAAECGANNSPPTAIVTTPEPTFAENTVNPSVQLSTVDPDGGATHTYSLTIDGADTALFAIIDTTLQLNATPDFEAPTDADADNHYEVGVQVDDGAGGVYATTLLFVITDVDETLPPDGDADAGGMPEVVGDVVEDTSGPEDVVQPDVAEEVPTLDAATSDDSASPPAETRDDLLTKPPPTEDAGCSTGSSSGPFPWPFVAIVWGWMFTRRGRRWCI